MRILAATAFALFVSGTVFADSAPRTYETAKAIWLEVRNTKDYQNYAADFSQFNNHFHLDEKNGCYALPSGPVNLMLIISRSQNAEYAVVERVLSDVANAKARCFEKSYRGIQVKVPPFFPFVLQLGMG